MRRDDENLAGMTGGGAGMAVDMDTRPNNETLPGDSGLWRPRAAWQRGARRGGGASVGDAPGLGFCAAVVSGW